MTRLVLILLVVAFAALVVLREHLAEVRPQVISDEAHPVSAARQFRLPPSGFRFGHRRPETLKNEPLLHPPHLPLGEYAYRRYLVAPRREREALKASLEAVIAPAEEWLADIAQRPPGFLCIGESHQDSYREFLAQRFFAHYPIDVLYLEAVAHSAELLKLRSDLGEDYVSLLRADIAAIIRAVRLANPAVRIVGAEETSSQRRARRKASRGLRDESLYQNIVAEFRAGERHAALLGALHCTNSWGWLYRRLQAESSPVARHGTLNIAVMSRHKDQLTREFVRFLRLLGFPEVDLVIVSTGQLDQRLHRWFLGLTEHFRPYQAVVLFSGQL